jgi:hypothetical protein
MKHRLVSMATWINADPRRLQMIILTVAVTTMLLALVAPTIITTDGWASGGSD